MKNKLKTLAIFAALFIILGGASKTFAQTEPIVGGYAEASTSDAQVIAAAKFAAKTRGKKEKTVINLISIKKARTQVVAGLNYQVCMQVTIKRNGKKTFMQFIKTIVYRNLKNKYSLTNWTILKDLSECASE